MENYGTNCSENGNNFFISDYRIWLCHVQYLINDTSSSAGCINCARVTKSHTEKFMFDFRQNIFSFENIYKFLRSFKFLHSKHGLKFNWYNISNSDCSSIIKFSFLGVINAVKWETENRKGS